MYYLVYRNEFPEPESGDINENEAKTFGLRTGSLNHYIPQGLRSAGG